MNSLNEREKKALEYIVESHRKVGYPPTTRQVGERVGVHSTSTGHAIIQSLVKKGFLKKVDWESRAITPTEKAEELLYQAERANIRRSITILENEVSNVKGEPIEDALLVAIECMKERLNCK